MKDLSRRDAIKVIGAAAGAVGIAAVPDAWETPAIEAASLPVAAAASPVPTATVAPTATTVPTATVTPIPEILVVAITEPAPDTMQYFGTLTPTILGTSTPGSVVTVSVDGLATMLATSLPNGNWSVVVNPPLARLINSYTQHAVEAWATKPPAVQAHAGPVLFLAWEPLPI